MGMTREQELIVRLCRELTSDISNLRDKIWLVPALVSHVKSLTQLDEKMVDREVRGWFTTGAVREVQAKVRRK